MRETSCSCQIGVTGRPAACSSSSYQLSHSPASNLYRRGFICIQQLGTRLLLPVLVMFSSRFYTRLLLPILGTLSFLFHFVFYFSFPLLFAHAKKKASGSSFLDFRTVRKDKCRKARLKNESLRVPALGGAGWRGFEEGLCSAIRQRPRCTKEHEGARARSPPPLSPLISFSSFLYLASFLAFP